MNFKSKVEEKYTLLEVHVDKLDTLAAPEMKTAAVNLFRDGTRNLIVDLSRVKYVDSSGLSAFLVANRLCAEVEGYLILASPGPHVMKLIQISRLDGELNILPTVEEAVDAIFMNEIEKDLNKDLGKDEEV